MTSSDEFKRLDELFQAVCDLPEPARAERLMELAPNDERLRSEVLELLAQESRAESSHAFEPHAIRAEIDRAMASAAADDPTELAGYRIVSRLGAGGMGVVYEAEQRSPKRTVALKVLRPGFATPDLVRRFEFEAEALGRLRHPGIAQVYEAGVADTPAGPRPYFAMELVRGDPLDRWVARASASPRDRLKLMAAICDAVQHAHAQGVIHRDLKPANILVAEPGGTGSGTTMGTASADPQVKVLDFGVARAADADPRAESVQTMQGQLVGTLPYMSPEQLGGDPTEIDTRSDIFSLGVILFELMSGRLPHELGERSLIDAARVIREEEPTRLSTLEPRLRGDVETIAGKALEKLKDRRYQSAAAMADDIRRHLSGLTIAARPPSAVYQLSRLAKRHMPVAVGIGIAAVALVAGVVGTSIALSEAIAQRAIATAQTAEAERRADLAEAITGFFNNDVLAAVVPSALGHEVTVREALDAAADTLDDRFHSEPVTEAAIRNNIGNVYSALGEYAKALPMNVLAHELFAAELGREHELTQFALQDVGALHRDTADFETARDVLTEVLRDRESSIGPAAPSTLENLIMLAEVERDGFGDLEAAEAWLDEFDRRRDGVLGDEDRITVYGTMTRAGIDLNLRNYEAAAAGYEAVAEARERIYGPEHPSTLIAWHNAAVAYEGMGAYEKAEPIYLRGLETERRIAGPDNPNTLVTAHNLAFLYQSMGRFSEAEPMFIDTLDRCKRVFGPLHPGTLTCTQSLAALYRDTERLDEAIALLEPKYEEVVAELGADAPPAIEIGVKVAVMLTEADEAERGEALFASIMPAARAMVPPEHPMLGSMLSQWGVCLMRLERPSEAAEKQLEAYEILSNAPGSEQEAEARSAARRLAAIYDATGDTASADEWRAKSEPAPAN